MASVDPKTGTTYGSTDWDQYQQGRPPYPPSLTQIVYNYRRQHPKAGWQRLVDIGAGSGVASTNFMPDFKIVHNSDPSPFNEESARAFLPGWAESRGLNTEFEYSQATGEEAHLKTGEGTADLAICATAAHFIDPDGLASSIAKMLRPGGTLAVYSYWMPTFPALSQHFHDVFAKIWNSTILRHLQSGDGASRARLSKVVERRMTGKGVLDSLPLPETLYEDPVRVYINAETGDIPYSYMFQDLVPANAKPGGISRVSPKDKIVHYRTGTDPEAEGWSFQIGKDWLSVFLHTFRQIPEEEYKQAYAQWEQVFDEECPSGTARLLWPAYLVLATRK